MSDEEFELEMERLGFTQHERINAYLIQWYNPRLKLVKLMSRTVHLSAEGRSTYIKTLKIQLGVS